MCSLRQRIGLFPGPSSEHPELELEGGWWCHLSGRTEAGFHRSELSGSGSVHHAGQPLLHEVLHQGQWMFEHLQVSGWFQYWTWTFFCLDWRGHVAEVLFRGSGQWNVHRVSVQCLRGYVFPHRLRVSTQCALQKHTINSNFGCTESFCRDGFSNFR